MNIKRIFGISLSVIGVVGLIYPAVIFVSKGNRDPSTLAVYGMLGFLSFISGISLIRTTKDQS